MRHRAFLWSLVVMLFVGVFDMTRSISGPLVQKTFSLSYGELGMLFAAVSIGYLAGSSTCGSALNHLSVKITVVIGGLITAFGLAVAGFSGHFFIAIIGYALSGLGSGWMEVGVNALVPFLETNGSQAGMFNVLHGLYGVGAFAFPVVATWLMSQLGGWQPLFMILAVLLLLVLLGVYLTRFPPRRNPGERGLAADDAMMTIALPDSPGLCVTTEVTGDVLPLVDGDPMLQRASFPDNKREQLYFSWPLAGLLIAITAYVMAEVGVGAWLPTYLVHGRQLSLSQSSLYLSGFYATFTAGRLLGHFWVSRVGHRRAILWSALFALVFIIVGELRSNFTFAFVLAGIGFAVIFPTITAIASETFPNHSGKVLGLLFTSAGIGSMVISWLIGGVASWLGLGTAFILIPVCLVAALGGLWLSVKRDSRYSSSWAH